MYPLKRGLLEFCEDLKNGKWEDAFRGRVETNKEFYALAMLAKDQGAWFTGPELWWYEKIGHVNGRKGPNIELQPAA